MAENWRLFLQVRVVYLQNDKCLVPIQCLKNKSAEEAKAFLKQLFFINKEITLVLINSSTRWCLTNEPFDDIVQYLEIVPSGSKIDVTKVDSYIEICDSDNQPRSVFDIPMCTMDAKYLDTYHCTVSPPFVFKEICFSVSKMLNLKQSQMKVVTYNGDFVDDKFSLDMIMRHQICILADMSPKEIKNFEKRSLVLSEIIENENNYLKILNFSDTKIVPFLLQWHFLEKSIEDNLSTFFVLAMAIHKFVYETISKRGSSYFTQIGDVMMSLSSDLRAYDKYVEGFTSIRNEVTKKKSSDSNFKKACEKLESQGPVPGLDIISYLVKPVQRVPNYRSHILRVLDATPKEHNDYFLLISSLESMNDLRIMQDNLQLRKTSLIRLVDEMPGIRLENDELYISSFHASKRRGKKIVLMLTSKGMRVLDSDLNYIYDKLFAYIDIRVSLSGVNCTVFHPYRKLRFLFDSEKEAKSFANAIEETKLVTGKEESKEEAGLKWKLVSKGPQKLKESGMALVNKKIFIIGGRDECGLISSKMHIYDLATSTWETTEMDIGKIYSPCVCSLNNIIYVYGGVSLDGDLSDFWSYSLETSKWTNRGNPTPLKGSGIAMSTWKKSEIVLTGGNPFKTFVFSPINNQWTEIAKDSIIPPLTNHSLVEIKKNLFVLCGQSDKEFNKNIYCLKSNAKEWKEEPVSGFDIIPRNGQCCIPLMKHIWLFGGDESNVPFCITPTLQCFIFFNENRKERVRTYSAAVPCEEKENECIYLYGGLIPKSVSNQLIKLDILRKERVEADNLQSLF